MDCKLIQNENETNSSDFKTAINLLNDSLNFMNDISNNIYGENYIIASNINKFLKSLDEDKKNI